MRQLPPFAQEGKEFGAFAQPAHHHLRAAHHLRDDRRNLGSPKVEAPVELLDRLENLGMGQVRIMQRGDLHAARIDEFGMRRVEPAVLQRIAIELGARIGSRERDLDGVRIDLGGKPDGLLDRLPGLAGKPENKGAVDGDAELMAILGKVPRPSMRMPFLMLYRIC